MERPALSTIRVCIYSEPHIFIIKTSVAEVFPSPTTNFSAPFVQKWKILLLSVLVKFGKGSLKKKLRNFGHVAKFLDP